MASRSNKNGVLRNYHRWLVSSVDDEIGTFACEYHDLMLFLGEMNFKWYIELDKNRAEDGLQLRYIYDYSYGDGRLEVAEILSDVPCSVLEMLVGLSLRCYDDYLSGFEPDIASPHRVFYDMIMNLGLLDQSDGHFSFDKCAHICEKFLHRMYEKDGKGNIFRVNPMELDCRETEIWWQMQRYVDGYFNRLG